MYASKNKCSLSWYDSKLAMAVVFDRDLNSMPDTYIRTTLAELKQVGDRLRTR